MIIERPSYTEKLFAKQWNSKVKIITGIRDRNPNLLFDYIIEKTKDVNKRYYDLIDEIQLSFKVRNNDINESTVPEEERVLIHYITW